MRTTLKFINGVWVLRCISAKEENEFKGKTVADALSKCNKKIL